MRRYLNDAAKDADRRRAAGQKAEGLRRRTLLSASAGDVLTSPLLPGLEISLAEVFGR